MPPKTLTDYNNYVTELTEKLTHRLSSGLHDDITKTYQDMLRNADTYIKKSQQTVALPNSSIDYDAIKRVMDKLNETPEQTTVKIKKGDIDIEVDIDVVIEALIKHCPDEFF